jgi:hypothetical protein
MSGGYIADSVGLGSTAVGASATDTPVSKAFIVSAYGGTRGIRLEVQVSAATSAAAITAKLQHAVTKDGTWNDVGGTASVTVPTTAASTFYSIILNACDATDSPLFPLRPNGRVVVTTGAGDSVTVTDVRVIQEM